MSTASTKRETACLVHVTESQPVAFQNVTGPDPVDVRLLSAVADMGRVAIPDLASRLGMDVRDVAARLAVLSTTGLPMIVGVECDPHGIRNAVAAAQRWTAQYGGHAANTSAPANPQPNQTPLNTWGPPGSAAWVRDSES